MRIPSRVETYCTTVTHEPKVPACSIVHWPGKTLNLCLECTLRAQKIADTLGFDLALTPLLFDRNQEGRS
jgi:hypothetical protein